ncbi:MAG: CrcB family protein [Deltaproteobacteria bacterium]|nr:CrcB family protein [Deltaproteobacteria bacterium]
MFWRWNNRDHKIGHCSDRRGFGKCLPVFVANFQFHTFGIAFPYGTILVNISGCFLIGFFAASTKDSILFHPSFKLFLLVGILGGFTTYSDFALETWTLAKDRELLKVFGNISLHIFGCFTALFGGIWLSRLT